MQQTQQVKIRFYQNSDYDEVKKLYVEGGIYYEGTDSFENIKRKIARDPRSIFVAIEGKEIAGTVSITEDGRMTLISRLAVSWKHRNKGMGKALMKKAEEELSARNCDKFNILVREENKNLQKYYEKQGYEKGNSYRWMEKKKK